MLATSSMEYADGDQALQGALAFDMEVEGRRPGVLVFPTWKGVDDFARAQVAHLARLGYVGFAADMYGCEAESDGEAALLMGGLTSDRAALRRRARAALDTLADQEEVDPKRIAAIGFCFGGLCALDLARSGAELRGTASFHGILTSDDPSLAQHIRGRILVFHGNDDPLVPFSQLEGLRDEMSQAGVDWEIVVYGEAQHGFMNPAANAPDRGVLYHADVARRATERVHAFYRSLFAR